MAARMSRLESRLESIEARLTLGEQRAERMLKIAEDMAVVLANLVGAGQVPARKRPRALHIVKGGPQPGGA
jgi:hypothetical protein